MQTVVRFSKCKQGYGTKKSLHKQTGKTLPSREASSSVLCSDSICSKTAPIAPNALRIEPKYLCDLFSIFNCLVSISWVCMGCQQLFTIAKQFQQDAIEQIENFGKMLNRTKYRYERRGYYTFAQQRAKRLVCNRWNRKRRTGSRCLRLRKGIIAASGYLAKKCALCADRLLPALAGMA